MAIKEAQAAAKMGEVPVGAVIVKDVEVVAKAHNLRESSNDLKLLTLRIASATLGTRRLSGCELYLTLEPCIMCAEAMVLARIHGFFIFTLSVIKIISLESFLLLKGCLHHRKSQVKVHRKKCRGKTSICFSCLFRIAPLFCPYGKQITRLRALFDNVVNPLSAPAAGSI